MMQKTLIKIRASVRSKQAETPPGLKGKAVEKAVQACLNPSHTDSSSYLPWETPNSRAVVSLLFLINELVREWK